ncbi:hypothetical protein VTN49DRAFT_4690 [Thermomyces lanuginosus]|uniref:uncharacterized protein n=1 Tax=Thermomyces lanuginosus TaxID=5541 RepID=UPI0037441656
MPPECLGFASQDADDTLWLINSQYRNNDDDLELGDATQTIRAEITRGLGLQSTRRFEERYLDRPGAHQIKKQTRNRTSFASDLFTEPPENMRTVY